MRCSGHLHCSQCGVYVVTCGTTDFSTAVYVLGRYGLANASLNTVAQTARMRIQTHWTLSAQRRLKSACASAQSDKNLRRTLQEQRICYRIACVTSEDSAQPSHLYSLIRIFVGHSVGSQGSKAYSGGQQKLIILRGCAGRYDSSRDVHTFFVGNQLAFK